MSKTVVSQFFAVCPEHGKPRREGRPGEVEPDLFRCDDCTDIDTMLDHRDIDLEWNEEWSVTPEGLLLIAEYEDDPEDD